MLTPARKVSTVMTPPVTEPKLQNPCRRFITGVWRLALSADPCTFIATSMKTSKNSNPNSAATSSTGPVENPINGRNAIEHAVP